MARRSAEDAASTKRTIIKAAHGRFATIGFSATSVDGIASDAGVTRGAVYHHFPGGKPEVFRAVFVELTEELDRCVRAAASRPLTPRGAFLAGCTAWLDFATRPDYHRIAITDAPAVIGVEEWHRIDTSIGLASIERGLQSLAQERPLAVPPTRALAILLFGALTEAGLAVGRDGSVARTDVVRTWRAMIDRLAPP